MITLTMAILVLFSRDVLQIFRHYCFRFSFVEKSSTLDVKCAIAHLLDGGQIMTNEQDGCAVTTHVLNFLQAFLLKARVGDGQHFIQQQNVRLEMSRDCKPET